MFFIYLILKLLFVIKVLSFFDLIDKATPVENMTPLSFENLDAPYGYVLYRTSIPAEFQNEEQLNITLVKYHDRASIFVDEVSTKLTF